MKAFVIIFDDCIANIRLGTVIGNKSSTEQNAIEAWVAAHPKDRKDYIRNWVNAYEEKNLLILD